MSGSEQHSKGTKINKFCSLRKTTCPCGNKYKAPCKAVAAGWEVQAAGSSKYAQRYMASARRRSHEAHHIACVASVTQMVLKMVDMDLRPIVSNTKWCVNVEDNMIALPLWPHTLQWYCTKMGGIRKKKRGGKWSASVSAPPFKDLAQHDYDHFPYLEEVAQSLDPIPDGVEKAKEKHKDPTDLLAKKLNGVISKHKPDLKGRGTHAAWQRGMNTPNGTWYKAFSMSKSNPTARSFPKAGNELGEKLAALIEAISKL